MNGRDLALTERPESSGIPITKRSSRSHLSARQQVVAKEDTQGAPHFEVIVSRENPVEFLCHVLEDVILILNSKAGEVEVVDYKAGICCGPQTPNV